MYRLLFFTLAVAAGLGVAATDWDAAGKQWWAHVQYLASDDLQGRDVGSPGFDKAANYVAGEFEKAGLKPGADATYFQPVAFESVSVDPQHSSLALVRHGVNTPVAVPAEAMLGLCACRGNNRSASGLRRLRINHSGSALERFEWHARSWRRGGVSFGRSRQRKRQSSFALLLKCRTLEGFTASGRGGYDRNSKSEQYGNSVVAYVSELGKAGGDAS